MYKLIILITKPEYLRLIPIESITTIQDSSNQAVQLKHNTIKPTTARISQSLQHHPKHSKANCYKPNIIYFSQNALQPTTFKPQREFRRFICITLNSIEPTNCYYSVNIQIPSTMDTITTIRTDCYNPNTIESTATTNYQSHRNGRYNSISLISIVTRLLQSTICRIMPSTSDTTTTSRKLPEYRIACNISPNTLKRTATAQKPLNRQLQQIISPIETTDIIPILPY